jgi:RHS repeat-associated protein
MPGVCDAGSYEITYAREFRYDSGRARYLNRELLPVHTPNPPPGTPEWTFTIQSETWTDYEGDEPYGDYAVDTQGGGPPTVTNLRSFEPGMGTVNPWTSTGGANTSHYHGDLIGTTRSISDSTGLIGTGEVYTAFGERVSTTAVDEASRYGYAGAWGYQAHEEFPFLHVGARYYDPGIGRFLQRDPIGIEGGLNVYAYCNNSPSILVDPSGHGFWDGENRFHRWVARNVWQRIHSESTLANMSDARAYAEAIGGSVVIGVGVYFGGRHAARYLPVRYSNHAIERMIQWGIPGSAVINAIRNGVRSPGNDPFTWIFRYENVTVVVNACGRVITLWKTGH